MNQQTLENILPSVQGAASHPAGFVAMSEGSFHELAASPQQFLSIPPANSLTVLINGLLLALLAFPVSLAGLLLFRDVSANFQVRPRLLKSFAAMVTLVLATSSSIPSTLTLGSCSGYALLRDRS